MRILISLFVLVVASAHAEASLVRETCKLPEDLDFVDAPSKLPELQRRLLQELHQHRGCALLWFNLGNVFYLRGDFRHASFAYQKVIVLESPLATAAKLYLAKSKRRDGGQTVEAVISLAGLDDKKLPALLQPEYKDEKDLAYADTIEEALEDLKAGRNSDAEKKLIAALNLRTAAYTYAALAVALHKQGRWEREQTTLDYARELDLSSEQSRLLRSLRKRLDGVDRYKSARVWNSHVDVATGYDNNVFRSNQRVEGSRTWRALVDAEKVMFVDDHYRTSLKLGATIDDYARFASERYQTFFAINKHVYTSSHFTFLAAPQLSYELYGDRPYLFRPGVFSALNFEKDGWSAGVSYEFSRNMNKSDAFPQIDGSNQFLSFDLSRRLASEFVIRAGYSYSDFEIGDDENGVDRIPQAYSGHGPALNVIYAPGSEWTLDTSVDLQERSFKRAALPQDEKRFDRLISLSLKARYRINDRFSVYAQTSRLNRTSTMKEPMNSNIEATTFQTGFSWEPF